MHEGETRGGYISENIEHFLFLDSYFPNFERNTENTTICLTGFSIIAHTLAYAKKLYTIHLE